MGAYYNEHDPKAAAWLRELIKQGHIAPGEVDERSIEDIVPTELSAFTQCHFFAGIGVWSYALRQAGWPDDRPVWTGSCPCQSFSAAGAGKGFADERHLWPAWFHLIDQCRPRTIFGEQVEAAIRFGWLDLVQSDLEGIGYACGATPFPACSVGAPHIRQRLYFVADASGFGWECRNLRSSDEGNATEIAGRIVEIGNLCASDTLALTNNSERRADGSAGHDSGRHDAGRAQGAGDVEGRGEPRELADATSRGCGERGHEAQPGRSGHVDGSREADRPGPVNGFWRAADWLHCTDGKWRAVEPGAQPLVDGSAFRLDSGSAFAGKSRVAMLRGAGNAVVAPQAVAFIRSYMEAIK